MSLPLMSIELPIEAPHEKWLSLIDLPAGAVAAADALVSAAETDIGHSAIDAANNMEIIFFMR